MVEHQEHFGRKFYRDKSKGYWISTDYPRIRAHVWVWMNHYGKPPKGCHIHHKDNDKSNNSIENLELMSKSAHLSLHMQDPERRKFSKEIADKYRHLTKEWHRSEEGRTWHKLHALKHKFGKGPLRKLKCKVCDKEYETYKVSKSFFCSDNCRAKERRDKGLDNEERLCFKCGNKFIVNRFYKKKYCSKNCYTYAPIV